MTPVENGFNLWDFYVLGFGLIEGIRDIQKIKIKIKKINGDKYFNGNYKNNIKKI